MVTAFCRRAGLSERQQLSSELALLMMAEFVDSA
jgi:hypothetical protein